MEPKLLILDGVNLSHVMEIENGSLLDGEWRGTFRCKRCRHRAVWPRGDSLTFDRRLGGPCVAGEIINPHVYSEEKR